ncbi:MAG: sigma-54 dependent transcriptional regulator [Candidatus Acidiferrum sp.]|jgi:DNA-binding NtrC family response regulator
MAKYKILVIEDEPSMREIICSFLEQSGHEAIPARGCQDGARLMLASHPDSVLLDYTLTDGNALDLLTLWKKVIPHVPVIILTGHGSIDLAVQAVKLGADQFITKPAHLTSLLAMLERGIENARNQRCYIADKARQSRTVRDPFIGVSEGIQQLAAIATRIAASDSSVLIEGETGTGKGVLARWIHDNSPRAEEPYLDLNCGGLSPSLVESELFGYERGAFTGAVQAKPGLFELAHLGTAFLDEIGDIDLPVQPKLLKVLEEKELRRLGDVKSRKIDIRLISATHQNLKEALYAKTFRSDLYFRINTFTIVIPPLCRRIEDMPALSMWLLNSFKKESGDGPFEISRGAMREMQAYHWPGNIRELKNVLERATVLATGHVITENELQFRDLPKQKPYADGPRGIKTLDELERSHIEEVLALENGRVGLAAQKLGVPRSSLYEKLKQYGIGRKDSVAQH